VRTTLKERDGNKVEIEVEVTPEEIQKAFDNKLRELVRDVRIPGFRPGKAPANMVQQKFGDEAIVADAVESSMGWWFAQAMVELGLEAIERPEVDLGGELPELGKPLVFTASVTVMPEVVLGEYKGLVVPKQSSEVADEEVDAQMERLRNEFAELRPAGERAAQKGDYLTADFSASLDGEPVNQLETSDFLFELGGGGMFPEVSEKVPGMKVGEKRSFPVKVPENSSESDLAGKTVEFSVTLKEIKEKVLPRVSDEWASEVSEFATLLELRKDIRTKLQSAKTYSAEQGFRAAALGKAVSNVPLELPEVAVQQEAAELLTEFKRSLEARGSSLEEYLAATGVTLERMVEDLVPQAAGNLKTRLVLDAVVKAEGIAVTDEEIGAVVEQMAKANKMDSKVLQKRLLKTGGIETLREQLLRDKAAALIVNGAVEGSPEDEADAGKPPAAKKPSEAAAAKKPAAKKPAAKKPAAKKPAAQKASSAGTAAKKPGATESAEKKAADSG
jgi:trigger factor